MKGMNNIMVINASAGHNPANMIACGAVGILNESIENRKVKDAFIELAKNQHTVYDCTCNNGNSQRDVLEKIVAMCNSHNVDIDLSFHLNSGRKDNAGDDSTGGVEVLAYNEELRELGELICRNISTALNIRNRGYKIDKSLYYLQKTKNRALLIECAFVDDKDDTDRWNPVICAKAILSAVNGETISEITQENIVDSDLKYRAHIQNLGWMGWMQANQISGTVGQSLRLEALQFDTSMEIYAKAHIQDIGWVDYGRINSDTIIGTVGEAKRLECLCFKGNFRYRVHMQNYGWSAWTNADGIATLGTVGQSLRIEAIQFEKI